MSGAWLVGDSATRAERALVYGGGAVGGALVWWAFLRPQDQWSWWQQLVAILVALDLCGGAISNAANSTKAQYQATDDPGGIARLARDPVAFAAVHVYPLLVVALYPGGTWAWAVVWYGAMMVSVVVVVRAVPPYLQRPIAMALFLLAVIAALATTSPPGWAWLPLAPFAKIVLGHAVRETPVRPRHGAQESGTDDHSAST